MPIVCLINWLPKDTSFLSKCEQVPSQTRVSMLKCPRMSPADPYSNSHLLEGLWPILLESHALLPDPRAHRHHFFQTAILIGKLFLILPSLTSCLDGCLWHLLWSKRGKWAVVHMSATLCLCSVPKLSHRDKWDIARTQRARTRSS